MKEIKREWCENWIRAQFGKHHAFPGGGIETGLFWRMAERSGLWHPGEYGGPMSQALEELAEVKTEHDINGNFAYNYFELKSI